MGESFSGGIMKKSALLILALVLTAILFVDIGVAFWDNARNFDGDGWNPSTPIPALVLGYSRDEHCVYSEDREIGWDCLGFDGRLQALPWAWIEVAEDSVLEKVLLAIPKWMEVILLIFVTLFAWAARFPHLTTTRSRHPAASI